MCKKRYNDLCEICSVAKNFDECRTDRESVFRDDITRKVVDCKNFVAKPLHKIKCTYECEGRIAIVEKEVFNIPDYLPWQNKKPKTANKSKRFKKPTVEEVKAYCEEKGYTNVDAERFINYYESKGWLVGKSPMKNWEKAVDNWVKTQTQYEQEKRVREKKNKLERSATYNLDRYSEFAAENTEI